MISLNNILWYQKHFIIKDTPCITDHVTNIPELQLKVLTKKTTIKYGQTNNCEYFVCVT